MSNTNTLILSGCSVKENSAPIAITEKDFPRCDADPNCQVCAVLDKTVIYFNLPWKAHSLAFLTVHQTLKLLGVLWLISTPILASLFLVFYQLGQRIPAQPTLFWGVLLVSLYWLYYFLKREKPRRPMPNHSQSRLEASWAFSQASLATLHTAHLFSQKSKSSLGVDQLFFTLLENTRVKVILKRLGLDSEELKLGALNSIRLLKSSSSKPRSAGSKEFLASYQSALLYAYEEASHLNERYVEPEDLFVASLKVFGIAQELFRKKGISPEEVESCVNWVRQMSERVSLKTFLSGFLAPSGGLNRDWIGTITPELDRSGIDFTKLAQKGLLPEIVSREEEKSKVSDILSLESKNNVLLIGPAGAGKTSIVEGLAQDITLGGCPENLKFRRIVSLDLASLVAGAKNQGELEEKVQNIVHDLTFGNIILFLDDLHLLSSTKIGESETSILSLLEKPLSFGRLQIIGSTTQEGYHRYIEKEPTISRLFQIIAVKELNHSQALSVLLSVVPYLERRYRVFITFPAVEVCISLSERYIQSKVLPDSSLEALEQASQLASKSRLKEVFVELIKETISSLSKVPLGEVNQKESDKLLHLEEKLHQRVVGQDEAVKAVSDALRRSRAGLKAQNRPIAAFLFLGPTGVGKTELARALAQTYFGNEKNMTRLDMAEYETEESISQLIGAPPGQKGYEEGGGLTEAVKNQPYSLLLLDEIEKAHPKIISAFLSVLDDGRLTDSSGVVVDFTNTIIIATSNAGSEIIQTRISQNTPLAQVKEELLKNLGNYFKPEFLNRFDGIIVYKPLTKEELFKIATLQLNQVVDKLKERAIEFRFGPRLVEELSQLGFDPGLGARPLRRVIQERVENYLANQILQDKIKKGDTITLESLPT